MMETREGPALKVRVRAVADKGEANRAVESVVAQWLGVAKTRVTVAAGSKSRVKTLDIEGEPGDLQTLIAARVADIAARSGAPGMTKRNDHRRQGDRGRAAPRGGRRRGSASSASAATRRARRRAGRRGPGEPGLRAHQGQGRRARRACCRSSTSCRPIPPRRRCWRWSPSSTDGPTCTASWCSCRCPRTSTAPR